MRTRRAVGDMRGEALRRGPSQVHALQHLRPVLCVCAPRARLWCPHHLSDASRQADAGHQYVCCLLAQQGTVLSCALRLAI